MTLITLGTQKQPFTRLMYAIENSDLNGKIIAQVGPNKYKSSKIEMFSYIDYEKMNEYVEKADLIITHGGTGSIIGALKKDKKIIACARLKKHDEMVDDHQLEIVNNFAEDGYILELSEDGNLNELLKEIKTFKPNKFKSNRENFIKKIIKKIE